MFVTFVGMGVPKTDQPKLLSLPLHPLCWVTFVLFVISMAFLRSDMRRWKTEETPVRQHLHTILHPDTLHAESFHVPSFLDNMPQKAYVFSFITGCILAICAI